MALDFVLADDCCPTGGGADERRNGRGLVPAAVLARADCELAVFACDGAILLRISEVELSYRTAGICQIVAGAVSFVVQLFTDAGMESGWLLLVLLPVIVVSLVGQYHCYMGHEAVLYKVDDTLADKWVVLWKWNIGMFAFVLLSASC